MRSLRIPVYATVAIVVAVLIGIAYLDTRAERNERRLRVVTEARIVTEGFVAEQDRVLRDSVQLLEGLATLDIVKNAPADACASVLLPIRDGLDVYRNFFRAGSDGDVLCLTTDTPPGLNVADRQYFLSARQSLAPVIDSYVVGRLTGEALMIVAHPVTDDGGRFDGILGSSVDLSWFGDALRSIPLPDGTTILMFDADGTVLATEPEGYLEIGQSVPERFQTLRLVEDGPDTPITLEGLDGRERMYVAAALGSQVPGVRMVVGVPTDVAFAGVRRGFQRDVVLVIGLGALVVFLFGFGLDRIVFRRLDTLMDTAGAIARGQRGVRTGMVGGDEIGVLGRAFDEMVRALEREEAVAERALAELEEREKRFRLLAENMSDLVAVHDPDGTYRYASPSFEKLLGWAPDALIGRDPYELFHPDDIDRIRTESHEAALAGQFPLVMTYRILKSDRSWLWVETTTMPIVEDGAVVALQTATRDVNARVRLAAERESLLAQLERSNRELEQFAYVASHDLQEPLRKIRAFGDRLVGRYDDELDDRGKDYLARLQSAAQRMQTMIEDLLVFSRIETQGQPFELVDLNDVLVDVIDDLESRIDEAGAQVRVHDLPRVMADPVQMHRLFLNLVGNAIKYRHEARPPVVEIGGSTDERGRGRQAVIEVRDNGIGFESQHAERIFLMFQRLHGRSAYEGTGVGLAVCRRIVERHAGTIQAAGRPGEGATFTVTLPVQDANVRSNEHGRPLAEGGDA